MKVACSNCNLRELCMPTGVGGQELARLDELVATRRKVKDRAALFRNGERFISLYAVLRHRHRIPRSIALG
jgi:CRP/FNR family transcriptional regulator